VSAKRPEDDWTREESRYVDGELDGDAAERLSGELRADPERRARLDAWREVMDLWRDDTYRRASRLAPAVLTDRVRRDLAASALRARTSGAAQRYAAAALVLIGLGLVGSMWLGARPPPGIRGGVPAALRAVEHDRLAIEGDRAWQGLDLTALRPVDRER